MKTVSYALFSIVLLAVYGSAGAGMLDLINGGMVGKRPSFRQIEFVGARAEVENKAILIDFWASWCEPCREFMPTLNQLHRDYADKGLVIVGLTQDEPGDIALFVKKIPMNFYVARDARSGLFKTLGVRAMPYSILVDKGGSIVWQGDPAKLNKAQLDALLKAL
jgi:cytochrome c biogenesis protein CcmG/thiol:disulfide interchange protein DsbE